ncbi:hypothetical protein AO269_31880 [Pseudomonas putida]|nr:hypothetical protein AO269_31880 [Pseudomonas putida]
MSPEGPVERSSSTFGALGLGTGHRLARFFDQIENAPGVIQKAPAVGRQTQTQFLADEQIDPQFAFQLLDPRGQVRRHTMHPLRRSGDTALLRHRAKQLQLCQVHTFSKRDGFCYYYSVFMI